MNNLIKRVWTRKELVFVEDLRGMAFTQEDGAHTFSIAGKDENGADLALSGTVAGSLIRPDGTTTGMTGTIADGCANLTLSPECYGVSGRASLTIFLTSGGQKTAIYHAVMSIGKSSTSQVSPGVAADVVDLVNRIDTATASIPATYTALLGSIASDYDPSKTYKTGEHVWYGGYLYKAEQDIDTAESWTSGHWTKVVLADDFRSDITSLKSALSATDADISKLLGNVQGDWKQGGMYSATGIEYASASNIISTFMKVTPGDTLQIIAPMTINILEFASDTETSSGVNERLAITYAGSSVHSVTLGSSTNYIRLQMATGDITKGADVCIYDDNGVVFAKIKEIEQGIALKSDVDLIAQVGEIVYTSSATKFLDYPAKSGNVIEIVNGGNNLNLWTQDGTGNNLQELFINANTTVNLTLTSDMAKFKGYATGASTVTFRNKSTGALKTVEATANNADVEASKAVKGIKRIDNTNYSTDLSNLNDAEKNSVYILVFGSTNPITNYPGTPEGSLEFLFTFGVPGSDYKTQMLFKSEWQILKRKYVSSWTDWQIISKPRIIHIGPGQEFTTLKAGIAKAIKYKGAKVIVHPKADNTPYDLTSEFATEIAADQTGVKFGNKLENDVHVIFETGAKVTALCENVSANITTYFNPFYAGTDGCGYTLENLDIEASNTRYCLHDEAATATTPRTVKILNCKMVFDNRTAATDWYGQCLGGGLGINDYIEIRGCDFDSKRRSQPSSAAGEIASYHNNGVASHAVSRIVVSDCYFAGKGTFKFSYWGTTEEISEGIINNCSLGSEIIVRQEQSQNLSPENIDVLEFNNVIRN